MSDPAPDREPAPSADITIVLRPGERLGPLRLVRELGLGGQGVVYEAVRERDGLVVAAKILRTDVHLSDDLIERFEREAQAAQRLHHANIVAVHGLVEWQGFRIILQELVTGGSLDDAIKARHSQRDRTGTADCRWAAELCRDLALALQHAHDSHVVHRDIKPGNVLLTPGGVPKITDFGLAKVEDLFGLTQTGDRMGTPNYMSPEQVEAARGGVDSRTDIYSLAAVLYRMLSRRVPFQADNLTTLFRDILTRAPMPPRKLQPGVPRDLQAVCLKALHKSPADRYQTAREFAEDLQRFLDGKATLARPEGAIVQATRALSHLALSTLAVVALLVPVGWLLVDVLLKLAAERDVGIHTVRVVAVGLTALVLAWPLSLLGLRLSRGRRWTVAAAWALAAALGVLGGRVILGQRAAQVHRTEREALAQTIDFEGLGERREVDDLQAFSARWEDRLEAEDFLLLGRGFLKRLRPAQAEDWARRLEAARAESPDSEALMLAVADALGDDERAAAVAGQLWQDPQEDEGWSEWNRAGDVLADVHRYEDAHRAYTVASRRPDAGQFRDQLNLKMAQVSAGLCKYEDAADYLDDYIKWKPDDAHANEVAITIASLKGDWGLADKHLATLEAGGRETWAAFVRNRVAVLKNQDQLKAAQDFVDQVAHHEFTDFPVLDWCAVIAFDHGEGRVEVAEGLWTRMAELKPESATPQIGLSSAYYARGDFRKSADAARRAIELDPLYFQSYYNLALALQADLFQQRGGDEANFSIADFGVILEPFRTTLRYDGLQPDALNNTAYIIAQMVKKDPGSASLAEADTLVRRSIRVLEREREGDCKLSVPELSKLAQAYDTLRDIEEIKGKPAEALAAARSALESLPPKDFDAYQKPFTEHVQRLEQQLAGR